MKATLLTILVLCGFSAFGQGPCYPSVKYLYDAAGNRYRRTVLPDCKLEDRGDTTQNGQNFTPLSDKQGFNINAFPNPTQDYLQLVSEAGFMELPNRKVYVNGIKGDLILQQNITSSNFQIDFSTFAPGYYTVRVIADGYNKRWKIQKM